MRNTSITRTDDQARLIPGGDVVAPSTPELRALLRNAVSEGVLHLTLDFANVQMVDSSGIGLLIATHNSLAKVGGELAVINVSADIVDLFTSMRIHQRIHVAGRPVEKTDA